MTSTMPFPAAALACSMASSRLATNVKPPVAGCSSGRCVTMKNGTGHGLEPPQWSAAS
jgi:hypothetical protein